MAKITLFLMTKKGWTVLESILADGLESLIDFVVVGQDKKTKKDYTVEIIALCEKAGIKWYFRKQAPAASTPFSMAISWRWLISEPDARLIVLHDSILPKYRGFAPLVNQLINGEKEIGVTALFASSEYDKGPIIGQIKTPVDYPIKIEQAIDKVAALYAKLVKEILNRIKNNEALPEHIQDESKASYSLWRDDADYRIDWELDAASICRHVNAVGFPYLGAHTTIEATDIRVLDAQEWPDVNIENRQPGKIIFFDDNRPVVVCGQGLLKIVAAVYDENDLSIFPLKKFRIRFK